MNLLTLTQHIKATAQELLGNDYSFCNVHCDCLLYPNGGHHLSFTATVFRADNSTVTVRSRDHALLEGLMRLELANALAAPADLEL
jgi:hypothetical protein